MADKDHEVPERHASWIELFFDLVVVAGVGQLAHLLSHGPSFADVGLYLLLFLAFWIGWAAFMVYGNVEGDRARIPFMLLAMLGLAVMVAAVPGVRHEHTRAFVIAYISLRWLTGLIYRRGEIVVDWPLAQYGFGALPWLVSLWTADSTRYWLWTVGIVMDLVAMLAASGTDLMQRAQRRLDRTMRRRKLPAGREVPTVRAAHTDAGHLAERLGLFVIIVLGEGVIQVITTVSQATWGRALDFAALGAFAVLVGVWALSLLHGFAGVPQLEVSAVPTRYAMGLHCAITAAIAALAAGLGSAVAHTGGPVSTGIRWLLCGSIAAYFAVSAVGGLLTGTRWVWFLGWALPGVVVPIVLGLVGRDLPTAWLIWLIAATVGWLIGYQPIRSRTRSRPDSRREAVA